MTQHVEGSENLQIVLRKLYALPLTPADQMRRAFDLVSTSIPAGSQNIFEPLLGYVDDVWLSSVGPRLLSVFNLRARTNNAVEAYHAVLGNTFGVHPNIWHFTSE